MKYDEISYWSEFKLDIIRDYASAYSTILSSQNNPSLYHIYIDAFAGAGLHISRATRQFVLGSPLNALLIEPPFREYHLIDLDNKKFEHLKELTKGYSSTYVYNGDCNEILVKDIFPRCRFEDYRRALCVLDPYGLHLSWEVIHAAGQMHSMDIFLNFPVADMNRNVLWTRPDKVDKEQAERMNSFWGDESWETAAYDRESDLFGFEEKTKTSNLKIAKAFQDRLKKIAGFSYVPEPIPMRNSRNADVYYLFFASQRPVAAKIVKHIFEKYKDRRG